MNKITFYTDINCASCKAKVEKALEGKNLYTDFHVDFANPRKPATFTLTEGTSLEQVQTLIKEAGYKAEVVEETNLLRKLFKK